MTTFKVTNISLHYFCFNSERKILFAVRKLFPVSTSILQYRYRGLGKKGNVLFHFSQYDHTSTF